MKRIAIGLTSALLVLTNSGFAQSVNSSKFTKASDIQKDAKSVARGGFDSGGGTLVYSHQGTGLLDLYLYNRPAFVATTRGSTLPETPSYKAFGFDRLHDSNTEIIQKSLQQIEKWSASSPIMAPLIGKAIKALPIYYTRYQIAGGDSLAHIPTAVQIPTQNMNLAALYVNRTGVFVEKTSFDALSQENQIAMFVHEALRHRQITFGSGISNENLQKLTAQVLRTPAPGETLDRADFMQGTLQKKINEKNETQKKVNAMMTEICQASSELCYLKNGDGNFLELSKNLRIAANRLGDYELSAYDQLSQKQRNSYEALMWKAFNLSSELNAKSAMEKVDAVDESLLKLSTVFTTGNLDIATAQYNKNSNLSSAEANFMQSFVTEMKTIGLFEK